MFDPLLDAPYDRSPMGFDAGDGNFYRRTRNDPVNFSDPSGLVQAGNPLEPLLGGTIDLGPGFLNSITLKPAAKPSTDTSVASSLGRALGNSVVNVAAGAFPVTTAASATGLGLLKDSLTHQLSGASRQPGPAPERFPLIRELTPGDPIVPQEINDLAGVREALENPPRLRIVNHGDQGNFVVDFKDGSVRFVTGDDLLPVRERSRRARLAADNAAVRSAALTGIQEILIAVSPAHETARDVGISFFGRDFVEPDRLITFDERRAAFTLLFVPAGNSGQLRLADNFVDDVIREGNNKRIGRLREARAQLKLEARFGPENVLTERMLLDARGNPVFDPVTGEARRLDFVIVDDARNARFVAETTSRRQVQVGGKRDQLRKENRVKAAGGDFVRDPLNGRLIDVSNIETRVIGVEPR